MDKILTPFKIRSSGKGFTLVEVILTLMIMSIIMFSITHFWIETFKIWVFNSNHIKMRADARYALERIGLEARMADSVAVAGSELVIHSDVNNDGDSLRIAYYQGDATSAGETVHYLMRSEGDAGGTWGNIWPLAHDVTAAAFSVSGHFVNITLTMTRNNETAQFKTTICTRRVP